ncbi:MAG: molybdopterin-binding protein [Porticoccaceae bacterium]
MAKFGLIIVGDEILSGRRVDQHLPRVIAMLGERGLLLSWVKIIGDDKAVLDDTLKQSFASDDIVFSTGGIGATPDDMTREAAARALGVAVERHPEGVKILEKFASDRGRTLAEHQYKLVEFPAGAQLIHNPINTIPGFSVRDHHFVPGFPEMAWAMIEWVLDHRYPHHQDQRYKETAILIKGQYESAMAPLMEAIETKHPQVKTFCLPTMKEDVPVNEIGLKGDAAKVDLAFADLMAMVDAKAYQWEPVE